MNPVAAEPPVFRLRLFAASVLLWFALFLVVGAQWVKDSPAPLWTLWTRFSSEVREGVMDVILTGKIGPCASPGRSGIFLCTAAISLAAPWCIGLLVRHALLRWIARLTALAACGLFFQALMEAYMKRAVFHSYGCMLLAAFATVLGLSILPGRKPAPAFIPSGADPEPPAPIYDDSLRN